MGRQVHQQFALKNQFLFHHSKSDSDLHLVNLSESDHFNLVAVYNKFLYPYHNDNITQALISEIPWKLIPHSLSLIHWFSFDPDFVHWFVVANITRTIRKYFIDCGTDLNWFVNKTRLSLVAAEIWPPLLAKSERLLSPSPSCCPRAHSLTRSSAWLLFSRCLSQRYLPGQERRLNFVSLRARSSRSCAVEGMANQIARCTCKLGGVFSGELLAMESRSALNSRLSAAEFNSFRLNKRNN